MARVVEVDALVVEVGAVVGHRIGAVEHDEARLGLRAVTASSSADSRAPFHLPIALQPSTQSWRVICVRDGSARSSASEKLARRVDEAADVERVVGEAVGQPARRTASVSGCVGAVAAKRRRRSASANSCAIALRAATSVRGSASFSGSTESSTLGNHSVCDSCSQPASASVAAAAAARARGSAAAAVALHGQSWRASAERGSGR